MIAPGTRASKAISVLSIVWAILTAAAHARFIDLPALEILSGTAATIAAGAWNALWWGVIRPQIERRKAAASPLEVRHG